MGFFFFHSKFFSLKSKFICTKSKFFAPKSKFKTLISKFNEIKCPVFIAPIQNLSYQSKNLCALVQIFSQMGPDIFIDEIKIYIHQIKIYMHEIKIVIYRIKFYMHQFKIMWHLIPILNSGKSKFIRLKSKIMYV